MSATTIPQESLKYNPNAANYLDSKESIAVVRPADDKGISGWVFDIPSGEELNLSSDITDHFTESGSFLNDHIVHKPIRITLNGFIGNLVYTVPDSNSAQGAFSLLTNKLGAVEAYLGPLTPQAVQKVRVISATASQVASQIDALKKRTGNLVGLFNGEGPAPNPQVEAYRQIYALWFSKQLVTCETPWHYFPSMLIESVMAKQDDQSNDITEFAIILKEARFADISKTTYDTKIFDPPVNMQTEPEAKIGPTQPEGKELISGLDRAIYGGK